MRRLPDSLEGEGKRPAPAFFSFVRTIVFSKDQASVESEDKTRKRRRKWLMVGALVLAAVMFAGVAQPAMAADTMSSLANLVMALFTSFVIVLMDLMGMLILMLVDLLIQITQYNTFVRALPVVIGWPIMRDTVNMFFIIVVLVSAFATIIGYPKDFHYKQVLPKLLIMAVLINFSKTLIGLMVDFSQVILLTFVNGFKQAAGGNFIQALRISDIMRFNVEGSGDSGFIDSSGGTVKVDWTKAQEAQSMTVVGILMAAIFGAWIMSITITLLVIMIIFFLARVIIIWFLLITSPIMFFAWALPGKLQKGFSAFTGDWWNRLSSALIGGPTMAFFLWLSLAMAQRQSELVGPGGVYQYKQSTEIEALKNQPGSAANIVGTRIGTPEIFASFFVMVAFMLLGVQVAVKTASSAAPEISGLLGAVKNAGGGIGLGGAAALLSARLAAKTGAKAAKATGRGMKIAGAGLVAGAAYGAKSLDSRLDVSGKMAKGVLGTKAGSMLPVGMQVGLAGIATAKTRAGQKRAGVLESAMSNLPPEMQRKHLESIANNSFGKIEDRVGAQIALTKLSTSTPGMKAIETRHADELKNDARFATPEAKKAEAKRRANAEIGKTLDNAEKFADEHNMADLKKTINDMREKDPSLVSTEGGKRRDLVAKKASDPNAQTNTKDDAYMDADTFWSHAKANKWVDENGELEAGVQFRDDYKQFMRGRQGQLAQAHLSYAKSGPQARQQVRALLDGGDDAAVNSSNYSINVSKDGKQYSAVTAAGATTQTFDGRTTNESEVIGNLDNDHKAKVAKLAQGSLRVADVGVRMNNQLVDKLESLQNDYTSGTKSVEDYNLGMLESGVSMNFTGLVNRDTGQYQSPAARAVHVSTVQRSLELNNSAAFAGSIKQAANTSTLSAHAEAINNKTIEEVHQIVQGSRADAAVSADVQEGLRHIVIEAQRLQQRGGSLSQEENQIMDAAKKLTSTKGKEGASVNRFIFQGHS